MPRTDSKAHLSWPFHSPHRPARQHSRVTQQTHSVANVCPHVIFSCQILTLVAFMGCPPKNQPLPTVAKFSGNEPTHESFALVLPTQIKVGIFEASVYVKYLKILECSKLHGLVKISDNS